MSLAMTLAYAAALAGAFGLIIGSFLNVVVYRLPRGESVVFPGSHCPSCDTPIKPYDNVPVLSLACAARALPLVPPLDLGALSDRRGGDRGPARRGRARQGRRQDALLGLAFVVLLVPVTLIDLDHRIIPNTLMLIGTVVSVGILLLTDPGALTEHLIAAAAAGGFLLIAALAYPAGMGMGDVKLAFVMGLFLGRNVGARDARRPPRRIGRRRGHHRQEGRRRRVARRRSRSARTWLSAGSSGCSPATRSSSGTSTPSSDLKAGRRPADTSA